VANAAVSAANTRGASPVCAHLTIGSAAAFRDLANIAMVFSSI
jgi:hypothetical protein